jgi:nucleotide-binding universal stress UspA family protein
MSFFDFHFDEMKILSVCLGTPNENNANVLQTALMLQALNPAETILYVIHGVKTLKAFAEEHVYVDFTIQNEELIANGQRILDSYMLQCKGAGLVKPVLLVTSNSLEGDLVECAEKPFCDLLICGTRDELATHRTWFGSFANFAVNNAHCSVLVVRPSAVSVTPSAREIPLLKDVLGPCGEREFPRVESRWGTLPLGLNGDSIVALQNQRDLR